MAFQEGALFDSLSVFDNVAFPLRRHTREDERWIRKRVAECLEQVGLPGIEQRRTWELSTGMRRRVGFARAIALKPSVLLFDEPTAGLDPMMISLIHQVIGALARRPGTTSVMVTHDLRSALAVGDRIALLFQGSVVADAPAHDFVTLSHPVVKQFVAGSVAPGVPGGEAVSGSM